MYSADKWLAAAVIFILVLLGFLVGPRFLKKNREHPAAPSAPTTTPVSAKAAEPATSATPPGLVANPTSTPGKLIAKARDTIAARDQSDIAQGVDTVLADATPAEKKPASARPPAATPVAQPAPAPTPEPPPLPSQAFREFVTHMKVSGLFQGEPPRALLNGKMYRVGDLVDPTLDITLFKIDADAKELVFRDADGAVMSRRF